MKSKNRKRVRVAQIGYQAMVKKYPLKIRREWAKKGAQKLNTLVTFTSRSLGGKKQPIMAKSLGGLIAASKKGMTQTEKEVERVLTDLGITHVFGGILHTKVRLVAANFVIPSEKQPKAVIYVTSRKAGIVGEAVAYHFNKLREAYPTLILIAIVNERMEYAGKTALRHEGAKLFYTNNLSVFSEGLKRFGLLPNHKG